jgi:hypothetical protein
MDSSAKIPKWLPKNRIYYDFERWGVNGLAPIIETRIQEAGGAANAESLQDHASRLKRSVLLEKERTKYFIYNDTHLISRNEFNSLSEFANSKAKSLEDREIDLVFGFETLPNSYLIIRFSNFSLHFNLTLKFNSTKRESFLNVTIASYDLEEKARYRESKDNPIESQEYIFDYNPVTKEPGWSQEIIDNSFILANSLVDKWLKRFLDFVGKTSRNNERYK